MNLTSPLFAILILQLSSRLQSALLACVQLGSACTSKKLSGFWYLELDVATNARVRLASLNAQKTEV